jgi:chromosome partitioning protein
MSDERPANDMQSCETCNKQFAPKFRFQMAETAQGVRYFCSQKCRGPQIAAASPERAEVKCSTCEKGFHLSFAFQTAEFPEGRKFFCSENCRHQAMSQKRPAGGTPARVIAVLNQKGGTGKTTTAINVAAGLAEAGKKVLLVDLDAQGNVGISLGIKGPKTIYHVLSQGADPVECAVPVRNNLDVLTSDYTLAAAEVELARKDRRAHALALRFGQLTQYDFVILDCAPSLSLLNQNALTYAAEVLVPVSCDYLSLVGVKQVLRTIQYVNEILMHPVRICGVLPTFFDVRARISADAVQNLRQYFKERTLPPVRVNTKLKESPSFKKTIFEHAPESHGARDYARVVQWIANLDALPASAPLPIVNGPLAGNDLPAAQ